MLLHQQEFCGNNSFKQTKGQMRSILSLQSNTPHAYYRFESGTWQTLRIFALKSLLFQVLGWLLCTAVHYLYQPGHGEVIPLTILHVGPWAVWSFILRPTEGSYVLGLFFNTQYKSTPKPENLTKWIIEYFRIEELVAVYTAPVLHPYYDSVLYQVSDGTTVQRND